MSFLLHLENVLIKLDQKRRIFKLHSRYKLMEMFEKFFNFMKLRICHFYIKFY